MKSTLTQGTRECGFAFFMLFAVAMLMVIMNIFLSIILDAYTNIKDFEHAQRQQESPEIAAVGSVLDDVKRMRRPGVDRALQAWTRARQKLARVQRIGAMSAAQAAWQQDDPAASHTW